MPGPLNSICPQGEACSKPPRLESSLNRQGRLFAYNRSGSLLIVREVSKAGIINISVHLSIGGRSGVFRSSGLFLIFRAFFSFRVWLVDTCQH